MADRWSHDPRYSHGFLVPAFALFLLWQRRAMLSPGPLRPSWWGLAFLAAGAAVAMAGGRFYVGWLESFALLPSLAGVALLAGGWRALRWSWVSIAFLVFMFPLPYRVEAGMGYPLQRVATLASNYVLQTIGLSSVAEGNIILIENSRIGVVEACNGLGMLYMFLAFTVGATLVCRPGVVESALVIASTPIIALAANVARICVTAVLHVMVGHRVADAVYHDLAGWLMMPLAFAMLWAEFALLRRLLVVPGGDDSAHEARPSLAGLGLDLGGRQAPPASATGPDHA
jgi:exosortase